MAQRQPGASQELGYGSRCRARSGQSFYYGLLGERGLEQEFGMWPFRKVLISRICRAVGYSVSSVSCWFLEVIRFQGLDLLVLGCPPCTCEQWDMRSERIHRENIAQLYLSVTTYWVTITNHKLLLANLGIIHRMNQPLEKIQPTPYVSPELLERWATRQFLVILRVFIYVFLEIWNSIFEASAPC